MSREKVPLENIILGETCIQLIDGIYVGLNLDEFPLSLEYYVTHYTKLKNNVDSSETEYHFNIHHYKGNGKKVRRKLESVPVRGLFITPSCRKCLEISCMKGVHDGSAACSSQNCCRYHSPHDAI